MRFGVCCGLEDTGVVLDAGYDYVELGAHTLRDETDPYFGLPIEATNLFFSGSIRLFGSDATPYLDVARLTVDRAAHLGVKTMVIGSGGARKAPDGTDLCIAENEFLLIAAAIQDHAKQYSITIAPESLNRKETNIGNDLGRFASCLKFAGVGYTADSYHVLSEWKAEDPRESAPSADYWADQIPFAPSHVHIANLPRFAPKPEDPMMQGFVHRLLELGYDGRVSLEYRRGDNFREEIWTALRDLHRLFSIR